MKTKIQSIHFNADKKLVAFIEEKIEKLITLSDAIIGSEVYLKLENKNSEDNKMVEIKILIRGNDLFVKKNATSFEDATDQAIDALKKQIQKHKEKTKRL